MNNTKICKACIKTICVTIINCFLTHSHIYGQINKTQEFNESFNYLMFNEKICDTNASIVNFDKIPLKIRYNDRFCFIICSSTSNVTYMVDSSALDFTTYYNAFFIYDSLNNLYFEFNSPFRDANLDSPGTSIKDLIFFNNSYLDISILDNQNISFGKVLIEFGQEFSTKGVKIFYKKDEFEAVKQLPLDIISITNPIEICYDPAILIECIENILNWISENK